MTDLNIKFPELDDKKGRLEAIDAELAKIMEEATTVDANTIDLASVKCIDGTNADKAAHLKALNDEMADLRPEVHNLESVKAAAEGRGVHQHNQPGTGYTPPPPTKSLARQIAESGVAGSVNQTYELKDVNVLPQLKADFTRTAGWPPEVRREATVVPFATTPLDLIDVMPTVPTSQSAIKYMEETTYTNTAAETAEGGAFPEAALALTERTVPVEKIPVFIPTTDEQLEDVDEAEAYLESRLRFMVLQRLNGQIVNGDGVAPNIFGILNVVGIQTQALGADPIPDAVHKALTKCRTGTGQAMPNAILMAPADWEKVALLRTADGIYIWGSPSSAQPPVIWGVPVVQTQALAGGTAVVGDFANFSALRTRRGVTVLRSNSHADYFTSGKWAIRADLRATTVWYRPAAFCTVTGL